jgi:hypothetical protein
MKSRSLFRFASLRPAARRAGSPHLIYCPSAGKPVTKFGISLSTAENYDATKKLSRDYLKSESYLGDDPAKLAPYLGIADSIPLLLRMSHSKVSGELEQYAEKTLKQLSRSRPGQDNFENQLWDSYIAACLGGGTAEQEIADLGDVIRLHEAVKRRESKDLKLVIAALKGIPVLPQWAMSAPSPGSPMGRGIRPAGIADLLIVQDRLIGYERAELSYIETVMKGEKKERVHRKLDRTYDSISSTSETAEESTRDTQTTNRSEMVTETQQTLNTEMAISTGIQISASFGPVVSTDTSIDASYGTSEENSTAASNTLAQDIVDRSATKITQKTIETVVQRRLSETEETNTHSLENQTNLHTNGIYRWLEQVWEAQIVNYGKRLMIEIMVPEPAALWRKASRGVSERVSVPPPPPIDNLKPSEIDETSYLNLVKRYGAVGVNPPPALEVTAAKVFEFQEREHVKELKKDEFAVQTKLGMAQIPTGYVSTKVGAGFSAMSWPEVSGKVNINVGHREFTLPGDETAFDLKGLEGAVDIGIVFKNFAAGIVNVNIWCERTPALYEAWQLDTYQKLLDAQQRDMDAHLADKTKTETTAENDQVNRPAEAKRIIERDELRRSSLCILMNQDLSGLDAVSTPPAPNVPPVIDNAEALREGSRVLFYENAFDWAQMTYVFYPYFWGRQEYWFNVLEYTDPDPVFESFLKAGFARVQIPVRPGFEQAVLFYMQTGDIWYGGSAPVIGDPLYVPISTEIAESKDQPIDKATPYGEPWTYTIPTSLVLLEDNARELGI